MSNENKNERNEGEKNERATRRAREGEDSWLQKFCGIDRDRSVMSVI